MSAQLNQNDTPSADEIIDKQRIRLKRGRVNKTGFEYAWNSYYDYYLSHKYLKRPILKLEDIAFHIFLIKNYNDDDPDWKMPSFPMMKKRLGVSQDKIEAMLNRLIKALLVEKVSGRRKGEKGANIANDYVLNDPIQDLHDFLIVAASGKFPQPLKDEWIKTLDTPLPEIGKGGLPESGKGPLPEIGKHKHTSFKQTSNTTKEPEVDLKNNNNSSGEPDSKHDVVVALINKGISKKVAQHLAERYSRQRIIKQIDYLEYLIENDPDKAKNPQGWLRRAIEENYTAPAGFKSQAEREAEATAAEQRRQALKEHEVKQQAAEEKKRQKAQKAREEKLTAVKRQYKTTPETEALWSSWLSHIRATDPTGAALLQSGCELLAIHDHEVVLWVDNALFLKTMQRNYAKTLKQLAAKHLKISFTEVELKPVIAATNSEEDDP